ncbi:hypothetical protein [Roseateles sp.]|uniref:hypothetical protein n=1 Tax=Roseateles sp. TaxID=1971397 RepID=UPI003D0B5E79
MAKPWACRVSLGTEDLATANRKAAKLEHEWLERFERQRKQRIPTTIHKVTPAILQLIKGSCSHGLLDFDQQISWGDDHLRHVCIALNVLDEKRESAAQRKFASSSN